jgi:hypothetical protein
MEKVPALYSPSSWRRSFRPSATNKQPNHDQIRSEMFATGIEAVSGAHWNLRAVPRRQAVRSERTGRSRSGAVVKIRKGQAGKPEYDVRKQRGAMRNVKRVTAAGLAVCGSKVLGVDGMIKVMDEERKRKKESDEDSFPSLVSHAPDGGRLTKSQALCQPRPPPRCGNAHLGP